MSQAVRVRGFVGVSMLAVLATLAVLVSLLAACAAGDKVKPVIVQPLVTAPGQKLVTVTAAQAGAGVELGLDQDLVVRLATGVVTGQEWALIDLAPGVLTAAGPVFRRDLRNVDEGEGGGTSEWRLHPLKAGVVTLRFEYRKPRNVAPASEVVTYAVTVR